MPCGIKRLLSTQPAVKGKHLKQHINLLVTLNLMFNSIVQERDVQI